MCYRGKCICTRDLYLLSGLSKPWSMSCRDDISIWPVTLLRVSRARWLLDWFSSYVICFVNIGLPLGELNKTQTACFMVIQRERASERASTITRSILLSWCARRNFVLSVSFSFSFSSVFSFCHYYLCHCERKRERERGGGGGDSFIFDPVRDRRCGVTWHVGDMRSISLSRQRTMHFSETYGRHSLKVRSPTLKSSCVVPFVVVIFVIIVNLRVLSSREKADMHIWKIRYAHVNRIELFFLNLITSFKY